MNISDIGPLDLNPSPATMRRLARSIRPRNYDVGSDHQKDESEAERAQRMEAAQEEHEAALEAALSEIGGRIREHRDKQRSFTQNQLAKMVGQSQSHVVKVESEDCNPTLRTLLLFKAALEKEWLESLTDARRLMVPHDKIVWVSQKTPLREAAAIMRKEGFSQLPVHSSLEIEDHKEMLGRRGFQGFLLDSALLAENLDMLGGTVQKAQLVGKDWMARSDTEFDALRMQMKAGKDALLIHENVDGKECIIGILTKTDLLREDFMARSERLGP